MAASPWLAVLLLVPSLAGCLGPRHDYAFVEVHLVQHPQAPWGVLPSGPVGMQLGARAEFVAAMDDVGPDADCAPGEGCDADPTVTHTVPVLGQPKAFAVPASGPVWLRMRHPVALHLWAEGAPPEAATSGLQRPEGWCGWRYEAAPMPEHGLRIEGDGQATLQWHVEPMRSTVVIPSHGPPYEVCR